MKDTNIIFYDTIFIQPIRGYEICCKDLGDMEEILNLIYDNKIIGKNTVIIRKDLLDILQVFTSDENEIKKITEFLKEFNDDYKNDIKIIFQEL